MHVVFTTLYIKLVVIIYIIQIYYTMVDGEKTINNKVETTVVGNWKRREKVPCLLS